MFSAGCWWRVWDFWLNGCTANISLLPEKTNVYPGFVQPSSPFLSLSQFASCRGCPSLFVIESGRVWQIYGLSSGKFGTTQGTARYTDCFPLLPLFCRESKMRKICTGFTAISNLIYGASLAEVWCHFFYFYHFFEFFDTCWHIITYFKFFVFHACQVVNLHISLNLLASWYQFQLAQLCVTRWWSCVLCQYGAANNAMVSARLEICRDRRDRRSCKIFPSCVKFWGNNANSLGNYRVTYALNE